MDKFESLKKRNVNSHGKQRWTFENVRDGLFYYKFLHGKFPTAQEIDLFIFLPTARTIQRSFGGLEKLRTKLGLTEINFSRGEPRQFKASMMWARAVDYESKFYDFLTAHIAPIRVHEQKIIRPGGVRCDFFVYTSKSDGVVIDLFFADSLINMKNIVNIKLKRYALIKHKVYFLVINECGITEEQIKYYLNNKKYKILDNVSLMTIESFKQNLQTICAGDL